MVSIYRWLMRFSLCLMIPGAMVYDGLRLIVGDQTRSMIRGYKWSICSFFSAVIWLSFLYLAGEMRLLLETWGYAVRVSNSTSTTSTNIVTKFEVTLSLSMTSAVYTFVNCSCACLLCIAVMIARVLAVFLNNPYSTLSVFACTMLANALHDQ